MCSALLRMVSRLDIDMLAQKFHRVGVPLLSWSQNGNLHDHTYVQHFSVRKVQVHLGLCGFQGVMWWPLCRRISKVACWPGLLSIWVRATLWNGSAMGSLWPVRSPPAKWEVQCLVSSTAQLPEELCTGFQPAYFIWPQPCLPRTEFLGRCCPHGRTST